MCAGRDRAAADCRYPERPCKCLRFVCITGKGWRRGRDPAAGGDALLRHRLVQYRAHHRQGARTHSRIHAHSRTHEHTHAHDRLCESLPIIDKARAHTKMHKRVFQQYLGGARTRTHARTNTHTHIRLIGAVQRREGGRGNTRTRTHTRAHTHAHTVRWSREPVVDKARIHILYPSHFPGVAPAPRAGRERAREGGGRGGMGGNGREGGRGRESRELRLGNRPAVRPF